MNFGFGGFVDGMRAATADGMEIERHKRAGEQHDQNMKIGGLQLEAAKRKEQDALDYRNAIGGVGLTPGAMSAKKDMWGFDEAELKAQNQKFAHQTQQMLRRVQTSGSDDAAAAAINGWLTEAPHIGLSNDDDELPFIHVRVNSDPAKGERGVWFEGSDGQNVGFSVPEGEDLNAHLYRFAEGLVDPALFAKRYFTKKEAEKAAAAKAAETNATRQHELNKLTHEYAMKGQLEKVKQGAPSFMTVSPGQTVLNKATGTPVYTAPDINATPTVAIGGRLVPRSQAVSDLGTIASQLKGRVAEDALVKMMAISRMPKEQQEGAMKELFSSKQGRGVFAEIANLAQNSQNPQEQQLAQAYLNLASALFMPQVNALGVPPQTQPQPNLVSNYGGAMKSAPQPENQMSPTETPSYGGGMGLGKTLPAYPSADPTNGMGMNVPAQTGQNGQNSVMPTAAQVSYRARQYQRQGLPADVALEKAKDDFHVSNYSVSAEDWGKNWEDMTGRINPEGQAEIERQLAAGNAQAIGPNGHKYIKQNGRYLRAR